MAENESTRLTPPGDPPPASPKNPQKEARDRKAQKLAEREKTSIALGKIKWTPFVDSDSLPHDAVLNSEGKCIKAGTAHFSMRVVPGGTVKVIAHYRNGKGIATRLVKVLKPQKKNSKGAGDRAILKQLRAAGLREHTAY